MFCESWVRIPPARSIEFCVPGFPICGTPGTQNYEISTMVTGDPAVDYGGRRGPGARTDARNLSTTDQSNTRGAEWGNTNRFPDVSCFADPGVAGTASASSGIEDASAATRGNGASSRSDPGRGQAQNSRFYPKSDFGGTIGEG